MNRDKILERIDRIGIERTFEHFSHSNNSLSLSLLNPLMTSPSSSSSGAETLTDRPRENPELTGTEAGRCD